MPAELTDERAAFEAWWQSSGLTKYRDTAFAAWEAALATQQATQGAEPPQHRPMCQKAGDNRVETCAQCGETRGNVIVRDVKWWQKLPHKTPLYAYQGKAAPPPTAEVEKDARQWADIVLEKARHAMENAKGLRKFEGMEPEARARELAASYLLETAESLLLDHRLAALQSDQAQAGKGE